MGMRRMTASGGLQLATAGQHVVDEPFSLLLTNCGVANHAGILQQVMGGLKHTLQMGWIALCERRLLSQSIERNAPRY